MSKIETFLNNEQVIRQLIYFFERWQDEQEYEDWSEYRAAAKKLVEPHVDKFLSFTNKPRALSFMVDGDIYQVKFKFTATSVVTNAYKLN